MTRIYISLVLLCLIPSLCHSQELTTETALSVFETIESQERLVDKLSQIGDGQMQAYNLPIGVKKIVGNTPFTVAITNIKLRQQYGEATVMMKMRIPQKSKTLVFGAADVKISREGDLIGDVKLSLLSDVTLPMGNLGDMIIKGGLDGTSGASVSETYVMLECNGDFKELSIGGEIVLNPNTFILTKDEKGPVKSSFRTIVHDWNDLLVELSLPAFELTAAKGFEFEVKKATFDFSDIKNPKALTLTPEYKSSYFAAPDDNLWKGLYVDTFSLTLPPQFANKNAKDPIRLQASKLMIDENGITASIGGKNILSLENGDASGWGFSVTDFSLALMANNIQSFGFGGEIAVPISNKPQILPYEAMISNNEYLIKAHLKDTMTVNLFGNSTLNLDASSYLQMQLVEDRFSSRLVMNGSMDLKTGGLDMEQVIFKKLALGTDAPYLTAESIGYGGEIKFNNFPVSINKIEFSATEDNILKMDLGVRLNLMKEKISAGTKLHLATEYKAGKWNFKGVGVDAIEIDNVSLAGFSISGKIAMEKDHAIYGNYFGGNIKATFGALSEELTVNVTSVFGRKDFRYWYVEGNTELPKGIPVGGGLFISGFTGGAYYRMKSTGKQGLEAYAPDDKTSLGVKAGISYYIASKKTINGNALFEMNFLKAGGIQNIKFYAKANFIDPKAKLGKSADLFKKMHSKLDGMSGSLTSNLPKGMQNSALAKELITDFGGVPEDDGANIMAFATMEYDFPTRTFDAIFRTRINVAGGLLKGIGPDGDAGTTHLHISPQKWFVKVGTPSQPIGLRMGLGPLSLKTSSYFMFGNIDEAPLPPDQAALRILKINPKDPDFMRFPELMDSGNGVAFGSRMSFDTGNMKFLILYAKFAAGTGFDILFSDQSNTVCLDTGNPIGINGWYAQGQCYAYLEGELGVHVKLLFINKKVVVIRGAAAALLQAELPNPSWIGGHLGVELNVLGIIKAHMAFKMSFGDNCPKGSADGNYSPIDFPIIADLSPSDQSKDVDVFTAPQATLNMAENTAFDTTDDNGNTKRYRVKMMGFHVTDSKGTKMEGKTEWNDRGTIVNFMPKDVLPPYVDMKAEITVSFEEYRNGSWSAVTYAGKDAKEVKTVLFKTGEAPDHIPLHNVEYMYPVLGQKNMFVGESKIGYVQLKQGQPYLFPDSYTYNAVATDKNNKTAKTAFKYNKNNSRIEYNLSQLANQTNYNIGFIATNETKGKPSQQGSSVTVQEIEGYSVELIQKIADKVTQEGGLNVLNYNFRTSQYNTLNDKLSAVTYTPNQLFVNDDTRALFLLTEQSLELFDPIELAGSEYTQNKPLIQGEGILDDTYYKVDIAPYVYNSYPVAGINITQRDTKEYGIPPVRAITLYDGYLSTAVSGDYKMFMEGRLPFVYNLPYVYSRDYYELQEKSFHLLLRSRGTSQYEGLNKALAPLVESRFLFMRQGNYKTKFRYVLPGNKQGATNNKVLEYTNTLDWRK